MLFSWKTKKKRRPDKSLKASHSQVEGKEGTPLGKERADLQQADEHWPSLTHFFLIYGLWSLSRHSFVLGGHKSPAPRSRSVDPPILAAAPLALSGPPTQGRNHLSHKRRQLITVSRQWHEIEPSWPGRRFIAKAFDRFTCLGTSALNTGNVSLKSEMKFALFEIKQVNMWTEKKMQTWHDDIYASSHVERAWMPD